MKIIQINHFRKIIQENTKADHWVFNYHYKGKNFRFLYILTMFSYQKLRNIVYRLKSFLKKIYVNKIN